MSPLSSSLRETLGNREELYELRVHREEHNTDGQQDWHKYTMTQCCAKIRVGEAPVALAQRCAVSVAREVEE